MKIPVLDKRINQQDFMDFTDSLNVAPSDIPDVIKIGYSEDRLEIFFLYHLDEQNKRDVVFHDALIQFGEDTGRIYKIETPIDQKLLRRIISNWNKLHSDRSPSKRRIYNNFKNGKEYLKEIEQFLYSSSIHSALEY